jgi:hypothetical protein
MPRYFGSVWFRTVSKTQRSDLFPGKSAAETAWAGMREIYPQTAYEYSLTY